MGICNSETSGREAFAALAMSGPPLSEVLESLAGAVLEDMFSAPTVMAAKQAAKKEGK